MLPIHRCVNIQLCWIVSKPVQSWSERIEITLNYAFTVFLLACVHIDVLNVVVSLLRLARSDSSL